MAASERRRGADGSNLGSRKAPSHFEELLEPHFCECHPGDALCAAPSVRSLRACLLQPKSIFHTFECRKRNAKEKNHHAQTKKERNIQQIPPLDSRPIQRMYNMTGRSESLLLCLARAPRGRLSPSFLLLLFIFCRLGAWSERSGRKTGGDGLENLKKGEAHCKHNM